MDKFKFQRQAYHSGALVGNDCVKVLQPVVAKALSDLLRPRIIPSTPAKDMYDAGSKEGASFHRHWQCRPCRCIRQAAR
eukprot:4529817-Pleurochrysis_carterae.AAC.1